MQRSAKTLESLPEVKQASPLAIEELTDLISQAHALRAAAEKLKTIKLRLAELIQENGLANQEGLTGVRNGKLGAIISNRKGRRYLDRVALVEAGVTPNQIEAGTKTGKESIAVELFEIGSAWEEQE